MVSTRFGETAPWLTGGGPTGDVAVSSQCSLLRNLAGFAFPASCREEEARAIEGRALAALSREPLFEPERYFRLDELAREEALLLAERRSLPVNVLADGWRGGVHVSTDQSLTIAINGWDHLCMTAVGPGLSVEDLWKRVDALDDALAGQLDYAFDASLGYLTTSLRHVGVGLKASVLLHLPCLGSTKGLAEPALMAQERRLALHGVRPVTAVGPAAAVPLGRSGDADDAEPASGVPEGEAVYCDLTEALYGDVTEAQGDLFVLVNQATLGISEEEILYHLRGTAAEIAEVEAAAREALATDERRLIEDRVARALALAGSMRLLGFGEAMELLTSLRLGVTTGLHREHTVQELDQLLVASQRAHLRAQLGRECDEGELSAARADLFRARFG